ncbi:beta-ketoacyl-[acyl-carrier-protein] synthase family protein [Vibrio sp. ZSDE26]|uniref:Beta-ketoacyl-[acyl-carrier-protein] synthase family protein n=1 Tax=Vibrio amylolyticus TaxID=2847292 RepID=A0A9X1XK71_9VIBR|nr:beta-ketoacyl-[acyl-carrier-protein] synthase family protein [Vibrio amylolyticus]MCK6264374.1 beta-ketoacyl-[acyl-carrier-protein] synthase family protein [Vibrio amylolyticus]
MLTSNSKVQASQPIYIEDCGFISAMGQTADEIHRSLADPNSSNMQLDTTTLNTNTHTVVGRIESPLAVVPDSLNEFQSRNNQLALSALLQIEPTIKSAITQYGSERIAVIVGTSTSGIAEGEDAFESNLKNGEFPSDYQYSKQELGNTSEFIANYFGVSGPCYAISTACSSSGRVFITAKRLLNAGLVDAVIVGGADTICRLTLNGFNGLEALSNTLCRPFSANRSGINIGESGAFMLLTNKPLLDNSALKKVALLGVGDSSDAHHISAPHPEGKGAIEAMRKALQDAALEPNDIGYINAHGTATPLNDSMESKAIFSLFGHDVPVSSTKPMTGHTLGSASATEAAIAWHILSHDLPLPKQNCIDKGDDIDIQLVEENTTLNKKAILSNSFAFGGNNISLIFGYADE